MGSFKSSYKTAMGKSVSHAWIALHRCVEANARLTGENFSSIFARLEETFAFKRTEKAEWPNLLQIQEAGKQLKKERERFLQELNELVKKRKIEKKQGKRENKNLNLKEIVDNQSQHQIPKVGFWGWRKKRKNKIAKV